MKDINILSLDLEMNKPSNKIIQVGFCIGNISTGEIKHTESLYINPEEKLDPFIINLTGIKQEQVDSGITLSEAYQKLADCPLSFNCFRNPITWGGGDSELLRQQLGLANERYLFGRRWLDVKTIFVSRCFAKDEKHQAGLGKALTRCGLRFEGRKHNAKDDAVNTFRIYYCLLKYYFENPKLESVIRSKNE